MRIINLTAENVKRLYAVDITPAGTVQVITGRNAQGKSSVLEAIWLALGGGKASRETQMPIRAGEKRARVELDLGDLRVVRSWTESGSTLTVTNADGAKYGSPQTVLDALVGRLSFDPLQFVRLSPKEQREALLGLVDIEEDLAELEKLRVESFNERTEVGRRIKSVGDVPGLVDGVPEVEVSSAELMGKLVAGVDAERAKHRAEQELSSAQSRVEVLERELADLEWRLADARNTQDQAEQLVRGLPPLPDLSAIQAELDGVEETNRKVRENHARAQKRDQLTELTAQRDQLTDRLAEMDEAKETLLAEAAFPVDGLGFDDSGVTFHGVPFAQASSAEQIRVSLAMAMALNPKLRVIRILDGSLLDADSMTAVAEMAEKNDFQVWIERVDDTSGSAVVIEDGRVA